MQQSKNHVVAKRMMDHILSNGQTPLMFLMNKATADSIARDLSAEYRQCLSLFGRAWFWITKRKVTPTLSSLCGLPVQEVPHLPDGAMFLQCAAYGKASQAVPGPANMVAPGQTGTTDAPMEEFVARGQADAQEAQDGEMRPTLNDLSSGMGDRASVSDVLIKAMEDCDNLSGVVVVRVHKGGDVDLCLNCNFFEAQGVLQKAQYWLATRGQ